MDNNSNLQTPSVLPEPPKAFLEDEFEMIRLVGTGGYSMVYTAVHKGQKKIFAVKKPWQCACQRGTQESVINEIEMLSYFKHPNIIELIGFIDSMDLSSISLVLEFAEFNLGTALTRVSLSFEQVGFIMKQLLQAIEYIHEKNVIHRDIRLKNILLNEDGILKLIDFGISTIATTTFVKSDDRFGSYPYRSIEIALSTSTYTNAIDIWAVGCVFVKLHTRENLFPSSNDTDLLRNIFKICGTPTEQDIPEISRLPAMQIWDLPKGCPSKLHEIIGERVPEEALQLINRMLCYNVNSRITAKDALMHRYFERYGNNYSCEQMAQFLFEKL